MRLSQPEAALLCWLLETAEPESEREEILLSGMLSKLSRDCPYAPHRTARDWRASLAS
jgi:hypothetical protein